MTTERDTHFLGFAKQELEDLKPDLTLLFVALGSPLSRREEEIASAERILIAHLAQRAYDLAVHTIACLEPYIFDEKHSWVEPIADIPDLTTLPPAAPGSAAG